MNYMDWIKIGTDVFILVILPMVITMHRDNKAYLRKIARRAKKARSNYYKLNAAIAELNTRIMAVERGILFPSPRSRRSGDPRDDSNESGAGSGH